VNYLGSHIIFIWQSLLQCLHSRKHVNDKTGFELLDVVNVFGSPGTGSTPKPDGVRVAAKELEITSHPYPPE